MDLFLWLCCLYVAVVLAQDVDIRARNHPDVRPNPFRNNLAKMISEDNEIHRKYLWHKSRREDHQEIRSNDRVITYRLQGKLSKRVNPDLGPFINIPCLFCEKKAYLPTLSLTAFTKEEMVKKIIPEFRLATRSCLFYGQRPQGYRPYSLSTFSTTYSCINPKRFRNIWQLWPGLRTTINGEDTKSCFVEENFYCLDYNNPKCCWLNSLLGGNPAQYKDNGMTYFRAMSRAMASTCRGTIYVIIDKPDDVMEQQPHLADTPSIWKEDEVDEMRPLFARGDIQKVITLTYNPGLLFMAETDKTEAVFGKKWRVRSSLSKRAMAEAHATQKELGRQRAEMIMSGEMERLEAEDKQKRAFGCTDSPLEENPDLDYFG